MTDSIPAEYEDVDCPDCGDPIGTNGGCLACLYAYETLSDGIKTTEDE